MIKTDYKIEEVDHNDLGCFRDIVRMDKKCFPNDVLYMPDDGYWWIAYDGMTPAAFAGMTIEENDPTTGYLCRAGVLREHRGNKLQLRLISARITKARELKLKTLVTSTYSNPHSMVNLMTYGFRPYETAAPWGVEGTCYWRLDL